MSDQQIRLHFGELNAAEMRLARAIVGWHEAEKAKLRAAADGLAEALENARERLNVWFSRFGESGGITEELISDEAAIYDAEAALAAYQAAKTSCAEPPAS